MRINGMGEEIGDDDRKGAAVVAGRGQRMTGGIGCSQHRGHPQRGCVDCGEAAHARFYKSNEIVKEHAERLERGLAEARECLRLIERNGGQSSIRKDGKVVHCDGSWCAEQARCALREQEAVEVER